MKEHNSYDNNDIDNEVNVDELTSLRNMIIFISFIILCIIFGILNCYIEERRDAQRNASRRNMIRKS